ncbi:MAG: hypothetical protein PHH60_03355 [Candidatus Margulisbacteria bacterium]|nr:hypothetical protein [Candidatus Margulisiibacteriota bacterium]
MRVVVLSLIALSLLFSNFSASVQAATRPTPAQRQKMEKIIQKVDALSPAQKKASVVALKNKLQRLRAKLKVTKAPKQRAALQAEINRVEKELAILLTAAAVPPPPPPPLPPMIQAEPSTITPLPPPKPIRPRSPQFGLSLGVMAGIPGALAELRFFEPFDLPAISVRAGVGYAQGEDTDKILRKHALVEIDGIYRLHQQSLKGFRSYVGAGLNYDAYTTGRVSGTVGGEIFYGLESGEPGSGQYFCEIGYGMIRTGFSPSYKSVSVLVGYKF